jgi:hypothetical protein
MEGRDFVIEGRYAQGRIDALPDLAAELVAAKRARDRWRSEDARLERRGPPRLHIVPANLPYTELRPSFQEA